MIDRYLIRYFLAVVDNGNFSRAAAQVNVTQPTLSVGIAKLEDQLGARLFNRSSQRVHLTNAGTRFLSHARRIESEFNIAEAALRGHEPVQQIRVGILTTISSEIVARAVAMVHLDGAAGTVEIVEGSERQLAQHVARGRVDVALSLVGRGGDRFLEEPLWEEGYALALTEAHPLATQGVIAAEDLADEVMIVRRHCEALSETSRYFTERGVRPFFAYRSTEDDRVMKMVAAGLGLTVAPESHRAEGVARPRLAGFDVRRKIGFIYGLKAETMAQSAPPFVEALRKISLDV